MKLQSQRQSFIRLAEFQLRNRAEKCLIGFVFGPSLVHVSAKAVSESRISALRARLASFKQRAAFKRHSSGLPGM